MPLTSTGAGKCISHLNFAKSSKFKDFTVTRDLNTVLPRRQPKRGFFKACSACPPAVALPTFHLVLQEKKAWTEMAFWFNGDRYRLVAGNNAWTGMIKALSRHRNHQMNPATITIAHHEDLVKGPTENALWY